MHLALATAALTLAATTSVATAAIEYKETVVHDTTTRVDLALNDQTVLCSSADYGALFLKVLIPQLASLTLLDHQNLGAGAPCVASGSCQPGNLPENILDASTPVEAVDIRVKAIRVDEIDRTALTCNTSLIERVDVSIRGIDFAHERYADLGQRPVSDCGVPAVAPPSQDKTDYGGAPATKVEAGGCSSTRDASGGVALAVGLLGFVAVRRRRR